MTTNQKRNLVLTIAVTVLATALVPTIKLLWEAKVSTVDFNIHVAKDDARWHADSISRAHERKTLEKILCTVKPEDTQCPTK